MGGAHPQRTIKIKKQNTMYTIQLTDEQVELLMTSLVELTSRFSRMENMQDEVEDLRKLRRDIRSQFYL